MTSPGVLALIDDVLDELDLATSQFHAFASAHEGYAVIKEELEELWDEIKAGRERGPEARREAVQVAAMALRFLLDIRPGEHTAAHATVPPERGPAPLG